MTVYEVTCRFEAAGETVQRETRETVERSLDSLADDVSILATGIDVAGDDLLGTAYVRSPAVLDAAMVPEAESVRAVEQVGDLELTASEWPPGNATSGDESGIDETQLRTGDTRDALDRVRSTSGAVLFLTGDATPVDPFGHDRWFVGLGPAVPAAQLSPETLVAWHDECRERLADRDRPTADEYWLVGIYNDGTNVRLFPALACATRAEAIEADSQETYGPTNVHRLELSKAAIVLDASTHRPGSLDASFRSDGGDVRTSRDLASAAFCGDEDVSYHPLGALVRGGRGSSTLYRPVTDDECPGAWEPMQLESYRRGDGRPWQFGLCRTDDALVLTQAMAGPRSFDPVVKRYPVRRQTLDEPLVFTETVTNATWRVVHSQPLSNRLAGERVWFLYRDDQGWHLEQPQPYEGDVETMDDGPFEPTTVAGVERCEVRTSVDDPPRDDLSEYNGTTREIEYRVTDRALITYEDVYVLVGDERREESVGGYQWRLEDATAYQIIPEIPDDRERVQRWAALSQDKSGALTAGAVVDWARRTGRDPSTLDVSDLGAFDDWRARGQPWDWPDRRTFERVLDWFDDQSTVDSLYETYRRYEIYSDYRELIDEQTE